MISARIFSKPKNDNYKRLSAYVLDAKRSHALTAEYITTEMTPGEKVLHAWCKGCISEDYELGISEALAVQSLNTRAKGEKTYHLVISFQPEDEAKLSPEVFEEIESSFAQALGFESHQRHCGVHKNTNNIHMHVAYNMINPVTYTKYEPFRDFKKRDQVCRELEQRFGLGVDNGIDSDTAKRKNNKAQIVEAQTGQQSFDSYVQSHKEKILQELEKISSWPDLHQTLGKYGLEIKLMGNGCIIKDAFGKHAVKASSLGRSMSKNHLESRLSGFIASTLSKEDFQGVRFKAVPLQKDHNRNQLYDSYLEQMNEKRSKLQELREEKKLARENISSKHEKNTAHIKSLNLLKTDLFNLLKKASLLEKSLITELNQQLDEKRKKILAEYSYSNWNGFLKYKAELGDETALAILRSKKSVIEPELDNRPLDKFYEERKQIRQRTDLLYNDKAKLLALSRMLQVQERYPEIQGFTYRIDNKGVVLFTLPSGGLVRDAGNGISFSVSDAKAGEIAMELARLKLGKGIVVEGNQVIRGNSRKKVNEIER